MSWLESKVVFTKTVSNLEDLREVLNALSTGPLHQVTNDCVYVINRRGAPLTVRLIVDKLSDTSEVYNVNIE